MRNYRDLQVWSKAHNLTLRVVSNLSGISSRRNLWSHQPVATCSSVNRSEPCGRLRTPHQYRIGEICEGRFGLRQ